MRQRGLVPQPWVWISGGSTGHVTTDHMEDLGYRHRQRNERDRYQLGKDRAFTLDFIRIVRAIFRDVIQDDAVIGNLGIISNRDRAEDFCPCADCDAISDSGVALSRGKASRSQCDVVIEHHIIANLGRLTDDDADSVVDKEATPYLRSGMNLNTSAATCSIRKDARHQLEPMHP